MGLYSLLLLQFYGHCPIISEFILPLFSGQIQKHEMGFPSPRKKWQHTTSFSSRWHFLVCIKENISTSNTKKQIPAASESSDFWNNIGDAARFCLCTPSLPFMSFSLCSTNDDSESMLGLFTVTEYVCCFFRECTSNTEGSKPSSVTTNWGLSIRETSGKLK